MNLDRTKVAEILNQKGATKPCHRCGTVKFTLLEDFSNIMMQKDMSAGLVIGGPTVPVAILVCDNCGAITFHAIGALGLLPPQNEVKANG